MDNKDLVTLQNHINNCIEKLLTDIDSMGIDVDDVSMDISISIKDCIFDKVASININI